MRCPGGPETFVSGVGPSSGAARQDPSVAGGPAGSSGNGKGHDADAVAVEVKEGQLRWKDVGAIVFVIDAQDDYFDAISRLQELIVKSFAINPLVQYHVFIHKVDGLSDDYKLDTQRDIEQRLLDELADASASFSFAPGSAELFAKRSATGRAAGLPGHSTSMGGGGGGGSGFDSSSELFQLESHVQLHFHLTSIFDTSVFVAVSKVYRELLDAAVAQSLESACDSICASCRFDKAYLMDVPSRTYFAADSTPFDPPSFEMVCEYVNFLLAFSGVYRDLQQTVSLPAPGPAFASALPSSSSSASGFSSHLTPSASANSSIATSSSATALTPTTGAIKSNEGQAQAGKYASSVCKLSPDMALCFWQLDERLALVAMLKAEVQARNAGLIDYNVSFLRRAVVQIAQVIRSSQLS